MVLAAMSTNWGGMTIGSDMIKLLAVGTLRWVNSSLSRFNCYFYITQLLQLGDLHALGNVQVDNMHGERGTISSGRHGNNILDIKAQGNQVVLDCVGGCGRGNAPDDHPVRFRSVVAYEVKWNFSQLEKSLEIQIITVSRGLAGYARFHSVGCKTQGLKFAMKTFLSLVISP
jgi:hypothetical protein